MDKTKLHNELDKVIDITDLPVDGFIFYTIKGNNICGNMELNLPQLINTLSTIIKNASQNSGVPDVIIVSSICDKL